MKKIYMYLFIMLGLLMCLSFKTESIQAATLTKRETGYYYYRYDGNGNRKSSLAFYEYDFDGILAYCIEPGIYEGTDDYVPGSWEDTGLSNDIKERLFLIAYYGYSYPGHQTLSYRGAAQALMWEAIMGPGSVVMYSTERFGNGYVLPIDNEKAEIERLIAQNHIKPSFGDGVYNLQVGESLTLTDYNGVINDFDVTVNNANYYIDGNNLVITPTSSGTINVRLRKRLYCDNEVAFFVGNGIQSMMLPGTIDPAISALRINSYYGAVEINKVDSETTFEQGEASLKGALYGVYETSTGNLVATLETDEFGYAKSDYILTNQDYYLKEISASHGYLLDNNRYDFDIRGKELATITVPERVIKNYISILKQVEIVYLNTTFLSAEVGITFEIFDSNGNKYSEVTTDRNGYATINLPYGTWKYHQVNTTEGFDKIYDFYITVGENSSEEQYYNILNNTLSAYLQVFKVDSETGEVIKLANTTFKILNLDTNEYVSQYVGGIVYDEFKTDNEGKFITYLKLLAGNYKLIEVSSPTGYLLDNEGIIFSIGNDTHYTYTSYGAFITLLYNNTAIKGRIEVYKFGELFNITDSSFNYSTTNLKGIVFNIYALEDIKSSDGSYLYYSAGDLVGTITTDEFGYAKSELLPLGKYYLKEVETIEGYVLDDNEYEIELTAEDNQTPVVYNSIELINELIKGKLEFTKTDLVSGEVIPNTLIQIYTDNDELIYQGVTDENGKIVIDELKSGKYYIIEIESATGYVITDEVVYFEIKDNGEIVKSEMKNKKITGTVEITKQDISTSEPLPNTLIEVYNDKDELVFSGRTDEEGRIIIENLEYGNYYFMEKEAPVGYVLNDSKMYFEIKEDGEIVKCTIVDEKIVIEVPNTYLHDNHYLEIVCCVLIIIGAAIVIKSKKGRR